MLLNKILLPANNLLALSDFYKETLHLPVDNLVDGTLMVSAGNSKLCFRKCDDCENSFYHFAFNIPSNKFDEAYSLMKKRIKLLWIKEYESDIADFTNWNAKSFYFEDPAGNILEMIARFNVKDFSDQPFSPAQIRNVSEIGVVFSKEDFDEEVNQFLQKYSLSYFDKQPPTQHFRAVGDQNGLFILVPENRIWFATKNKESKILPIEIEFTVSQKKFKYIID